MPSVDLVRSVPIARTARVMQLEGIFDVPPSQCSEEHWAVNLDLPDEWSVGLIVGPSGAGKTTVARELFGNHLVGAWQWPTDKSVLDGFPASMAIKEIVELLSSVGFSSPPSWLRPYAVLSNGEQFRVNMARTLAEMPDLAVVDEFTSVVDRTVAQIGSAAVAKTVRRRKQRFIAVSCHYDIIEWLQPDWVYQPQTNELARGWLQRPDIDLTIQRVHSSAWQLFRKHHYLDAKLNTSAVCFVAMSQGQPVAFGSWLHFPHPHAPNIKREHRLVCLPDFQGVGIGNALSAYLGSLATALGFRYTSITSHPSMVRARNRSPVWRVTTKPTYAGKRMPNGPMKFSSGMSGDRPIRVRASFEYIGPALDHAEALRLWNGT